VYNSCSNDIGYLPPLNKNTNNIPLHQKNKWLSVGLAFRSIFRTKFFVVLKSSKEFFFERFVKEINKNFEIINYIFLHRDLENIKNEVLCLNNQEKTTRGNYNFYDQLSVNNKYTRDPIKHKKKYK
jgi:hypothetical protein